MGNNGDSGEELKGERGWLLEVAHTRTINSHLLPHIQCFEELESQAHISTTEEAVTPIQL